MSKISFTNPSFSLSQRKECVISQIKVDDRGTQISFSDDPSDLIFVSSNDISVFGFTAGQKVVIEPFVSPEHTFSIEIVPETTNSTKTKKPVKPNPSSPTHNARLRNGWNF